MRIQIRDTSGPTIETAPTTRSRPDEAGFIHPAVVVTARRILDAGPSVVHVVPLATTLRRFHSEVIAEPDTDNGLPVVSAAQCQYLRSVSSHRIVATTGSVGAITLTQMERRLP